MLNLIARDLAGSDRWAVAESTYREAIELARESGQQTELVFGLAGLAWLQARRGREQECRALAAEALALADELGARLHVIWATAALGELELALGEEARAVEHLERRRELLRETAISDVDLSPAAELVDAYLRLGRRDDAEAGRRRVRGRRRGQGAAVVARPRAALRAGCWPATPSSPRRSRPRWREHARTPDAFEEARTRLAYGQRLRRARQRVLAREQLRSAADTFERLDAAPVGRPRPRRAGRERARRCAAATRARSTS